jgi:hypothetical protein
MDKILLKKAFIEAYKKTYGNISNACETIGISRQTFYNWQEEDAEFKAEIEAIEPNELLMDLVESKLVEKIKEGDTTVLIFVSKTKGKKRGYVEKKELDVSGGLGITWNEQKTYDSNEEADKGD